MTQVSTGVSVVFDKVEKQFGSVRALEPISLEIRSGEFLTLLGVFRVNTWVALFATTGVILSACYALWLYRKVIFGALTKESLEGLLDLSPREKAILYPLIVLVIFFGVYPAPVFDATASSVEALVNTVTISIDGTHAAAAN